MRRLRVGIIAFCSATALAALSVGAMVGAPGCTVLTNDALPDDAGTFEGGFDATSTACTSCVELECAGPWAVCLTDSRCVALRQCNNPLGESQGSRDGCFCANADAAAPTPDGGADPLPAYGAFASCNDARTCGKCATDCSSSCGAGGTKSTGPSSCGGSDAGASDAAMTDGGDGGDAGAASDASADASAPPQAPSVDRCESCISDKCGDAKKLCALGTDCAAFLTCGFGCAGAACVDACGKSHSSGKASAMELSSCTLTSCRSACGL